jgi:dTDP-4-amino-4,6-dideoxygalactose transaminase
MIPFIDLKTQFKHLEKDIRVRMDAVLEHGKFIMGPEVKELEEKLSAFIGVKHCIGCASGTDALLMALMAMDVLPMHPYLEEREIERICKIIGNEISLAEPAEGK